MVWVPPYHHIEYLDVCDTSEIHFLLPWQPGIPERTRLLSSGELRSGSDSVITSSVVWTSHFTSCCFDWLSCKGILIALAFLNRRYSSRSPTEGLTTGKSYSCPWSLSKDRNPSGFTPNHSDHSRSEHTRKNKLSLKWKLIHLLDLACTKYNMACSLPRSKLPHNATHVRILVFSTVAWIYCKGF